MMDTASADDFAYLSADRPLTDPKDDRLGYAPFARQLAHGVSTMGPTEGLVLAVYGPWGSGKTTVLQFFLHYLGQMPEEERPIVVRFNPWLFSGHDDLTKRFLFQLQGTLKKTKLPLSTIAACVGDFAEIIGELPVPYLSGVGKAVDKVRHLAEKDAVETKDSLVELLRKIERRILVIVDDIDRLTADEIRQLFRVVKAVADFPNTIYLLAFDKEVAIQAVQQLQGASGADYLEKIVQVPFELPLPDREALRRLLFEKLEAILDGTPGELFDGAYWTNVYFEGIDQFIDTPRDIVRLTNTLGVTYAAVKAEVNAVDFVAIEALRVFAPSLYDLIRRNPDEFAGFIARSLYGPTNGDRHRAFHQATLDTVPGQYREGVKRLLLRLFPRLHAVWGNTFYGAESAAGWRKQLRICSPDVFPVYFRLAVPGGALSYAELRGILALANDASAFGAKLVELAEQIRPDGATRVSGFLSRLEDYTGEEIAGETITPLVCGLFDVGDRLLSPQDEPRGLLGQDNGIRIGRVVWQLLRRLDEPARFVLLKDAIGRSTSVSIIVDQVVVLGQQHGKYGEATPDRQEDQLVTAEHLQALEALALEKVRSAARDGTLDRVPRLLGILYRWRDWAGPEEVQRWVQQLVATDEGMLLLLERLVHTTRTWNVSDIAVQSQPMFSLNSLAAFAEPLPLAPRAQELAQNGKLTDSQRNAVTLFLRSVEDTGHGDERRERPESP